MPEPVLLVHGFGSSFAHQWVDSGWVDILADEGRSVLGGDLLGHGEAAKPADPASYARMDDYVMGMVGTNERVDAVGFSMGAGILLRLASNEPDRFRRVVLMGVGANLLHDGDRDHGNGGGGVLADAVEGSLEVLDDPVVRMFVQLAKEPRNDRAALAAVLRRRAPRLVLEELSRVRVPVLVILGERDFAGPGEPLVDALPDARLVVIPGADHFATPTDYVAIDAAMRFIEERPTVHG